MGLSYSTHHADYNTNDTATAADSHAFLRAFFDRYPHLQQNDFYIAGQSGSDGSSSQSWQTAVRTVTAVCDGCSHMLSPQLPVCLPGDKVQPPQLASSFLPPSPSLQTTSVCMRHLRTRGAPGDPCWL